MKKVKFGKVWLAAFDNDNSALVPEIWAQESLMFLENSMVMGMLVHRDFQNEVARFGEVVNTRRPSGFEAVRKVDGDDVTVQDASLVNVAIRMDQHWHTSFLIYDGEESKSMQSLIETHAQPALSSIAQAIDQTIFGESYNFMDNYAGKLGTTPTAATMIALRESLTKSKCPLVGRRLTVSPDAEGSFLNIADWVNANSVGDEGSAMREGHLGRKFGFDTFTSQNVPAIAAGNTVDVTGNVDLVGGYAVDTTTLAVEGFTGSPTRILGAWITLAGDMTPQRVTAIDTNSGGDLVEITIDPGLRYAVANDAAITIYTPGTINQAVSPAGYAQYWVKEMVLSNFSVAPKSGQLVAFGTGEDLFGTVGTPTATGVTLSRSLDTAVANAANVAIGPAGQYCLGFHKNAIALVTRPLAMPVAGSGVRSAVANYNGLSIRATITYDPYKQGHLVTLDLLAGVKTLDSSLGAVMFA